MVGVSSSGRSFRAIAAYLAAGRSGHEHDRVAWTAARNLPTDEPELAGKIMRATAAANARVRLPVYHLALSFDPNDRVDRAMMERVADDVLEALELKGHQALLVAHRDREHAHVHLLVNRVHPETGKAWDRWQDQRVVQEVLRAEERALGLREVPGKLAPVPTTMETQRADVAIPTAPAAEVRVRDEVSAPTGEPELRTAVSPPASSTPDPDRVTALAREQFTAARAADAARARSRQLDAAAERVDATGRELARALGAVYADPERAGRLFAALADRRGAAHAERELRERPEAFGALLVREPDRRGAFGLRRGGGRHAPSLESVAAAAARGRAHLEARDAFAAAAVESRERRLESALDRALADRYADPAAARTAFVRLAVEQGTAHAARVLASDPVALGAPRLGMSEPASLDGFEAWRRTAIAAGVALVESRQPPAEPGTAPRRRDAERLAAEPALARREAELWAAREHSARQALQAALAAPSAAVEPSLAPDRRADAAHVATRIADSGGGPASTPGRLLAGHVRRAVVDAMLDRGEHEA